MFLVSFYVLISCFFVFILNNATFPELHEGGAGFISVSVYSHPLKYIVKNPHAHPKSTPYIKIYYFMLFLLIFFIFYHALFLERGMLWG